MKRIIFILMLMLSGMVMLAQAPTVTQMNATLNIGQVNSATTGDYKITGFFNDLTGIYSTQDVAVGDIIWDGKCDVYEVVVIVQRTPSLIVEVDDVNGGGSTIPSTSIGVIFRQTVNYDYPIITTGMPEKLLACIETHRAIEIDEDIKSLSDQNGTITGPYDNDDDAAANSVGIGERYFLSVTNTLGGSFGDVRTRRF